MGTIKEAKDESSPHTKNVREFGSEFEYSKNARSNIKPSAFKQAMVYKKKNTNNSYKLKSKKRY